MNKKQTKYNLAVSYTKSPLIIQPSQHIYPTLTNINGKCKQDISNIFNNNFEIRLRKLQIEHERNYEVVGYKEIQDINLRVQRKKHMQIQTKQQNKTIQSRSSSIKNTHKFLTKNQVIDFYSPTQTKRSNNQKQEKKIGKKHKTHLSQQFSLSKLKLRMEQYKQSWIHQIQRKKKVVTKRNKNSQTKGKSVLQSIEQYRTISQQRQQAYNKQNDNQFAPSMWQKALRNDKCYQSNHNITRIISSGIKTVGYGKYHKELLWLQEKDQNGFFFRKDQSLKSHYRTPNFY